MEGRSRLLSLRKRTLLKRALRTSGYLTTYVNTSGILAVSATCSSNRVRSPRGIGETQWACLAVEIGNPGHGSKSVKVGVSPQPPSLPSVCNVVLPFCCPQLGIFILISPMGFTSLAGTWLGPLTTTWSMPDSCTAFLVNCPTCDGGFRGQQCVVHSGTGRAEDHTSCWPPARTQAGTPQYPFVGWGFYSPGLACPTGYTSACTAVYGGRADWEIEFTLNAGETAVGCCPT